MGILDIFKKKTEIKLDTQKNIESEKINSIIQHQPVNKKVYTYKGKNYLTTDGVAEEIKLFEKEVCKVPEELKKFWENEGFGFIAENKDGFSFNRLLSPSEVVDFINRTDIYEWIPDSDFYTSIQDKGFVIMEYSEYIYFWIGIQPDNLGNIFYFNSKICDNFNELVKKLENDEDVLEGIQEK